MATQPVEIHLQLAALARTRQTPIGYIHWSRIQRRSHWTAVEPALTAARLAWSRLRSVQRPSWPALLIAALAAAALMWWVMREQLPAIDPQAIIATHLTAARDATAARRYLEPLEHSALHHYRTVLAIDPANAEARQGLAMIADGFVDDARAAILDGHLADAVIALDGLRRVAPDHRRLPLLSTQLRRAVDALAVERALEAKSAAPAAAQPERAAAADVAPPRTSGTQDAPAKRADAAAPTARDAAVKAAAVQPPPAIKIEDSNRDAPALPPLADASTAEAQSALALAQPPAPAAADQAAPAPPPHRKLARYVAPEYPREALLRGIEGWVDLDLTVNAAGDVVASNVLGGKARQLFDRAALGAVRRWKYEPQTGADPFQAIEVRVTFELQE